MARPPYVSFAVRTSEPGRRASSRDIVSSLVDEIGSGRIPPGCRLPPVRALEQQLGLSKNTAQAAYEELVARGVLEGANAKASLSPRSSNHRPTPEPSPHLLRCGCDRCER